MNDGVNGEENSIEKSGEKKENEESKQKGVVLANEKRSRTILERTTREILNNVASGC